MACDSTVDLKINLRDKILADFLGSLERSLSERPVLSRSYGVRPSLSGRRANNPLKTYVARLPLKDRRTITV